jgi:hypothetical protein
MDPLGDGPVLRVIFAIESRAACSSSAFLAPFLPSARSSAARAFIAARSAAEKPSLPVSDVFVGMIILPSSFLWPSAVPAS